MSTEGKPENSEKTEHQRTLRQNNALHKWCELLGDALNDAGYEMKAVLAVKSVDVPWSKERVKEVLVQPIAEAMFGEPHTSKLTTVQMQEVYKVLDRHISENFGVHVEWPSWR